MSLRVSLNTNNSNIDTDKLIIESALSSQLITQTRRDELILALEGIKDSNNTTLALLDTSMGSKRAGNYSSFEDVLNNKELSKNETIRSLNKYKADSDTSPLSASNLILCNLENIDIDYSSHSDIIDIESWFDNDYINYLSTLTSKFTMVNDIQSTVSTMKANVDSFIQGIKGLANNVSIASVLDLPLPTEEIEKFLCGKSVEDLAFINDFSSSLDKSAFLNEKIVDIKF